jgi:hypothetical protein
MMKMNGRGAFALAAEQIEFTREREAVIPLRKQILHHLFHILCIATASAIIGYFVHNFVAWNMHKIHVQVAPDGDEANTFGVSRYFFSSLFAITNIGLTPFVQTF